MRSYMGSVHIGGKTDGERKGYILQDGDTVSTGKLTHRFSDPPSDDPKKPRIDDGKAEIAPEKGMLFCMIYIGSHKKGAPFTEEEIERRLNKLGWYRRESPDTLPNSVL